MNLASAAPAHKPSSKRNSSNWIHEDYRFDAVHMVQRSSPGTWAGDMSSLQIRAKWSHFCSNAGRNLRSRISGLQNPHLIQLSASQEEPLPKCLLKRLAQSFCGRSLLGLPVMDRRRNVSIRHAYHIWLKESRLFNKLQPLCDSSARQRVQWMFEPSRRSSFEELSEPTNQKRFEHWMRRHFR